MRCLFVDSGNSQQRDASEPNKNNVTRSDINPAASSLAPVSHLPFSTHSHRHLKFYLPRLQPPYQQWPPNLLPLPAKPLPPPPPRLPPSLRVPKLLKRPRSQQQLMAKRRSAESRERRLTLPTSTRVCVLSTLLIVHRLTRIRSPEAGSP